MIYINFSEMEFYIFTYNIVMIITRFITIWWILIYSNNFMNNEWTLRGWLAKVIFVLWSRSIVRGMRKTWTTRPQDAVRRTNGYNLKLTACYPIYLYDGIRSGLCIHVQNDCDDDDEDWCRVVSGSGQAASSIWMK